MRWGKRICVVTMLALLMVFTGCFRSFRSQRVSDDGCPFRGAPATVLKAYVAQVSWAKIVEGEGIQVDANGNPVIVARTQHVCQLPEIYGVDVVAAPVGTTKAEIHYHDDGTLAKVTVDKDQQIDELISAIGDVAESFVPAGTRAGIGDTFTPGLDETAASLKAAPVSIEILHAAN